MNNVPSVNDSNEQSGRLDRFRKHMLFRTLGEICVKLEAKLPGSNLAGKKTKNESGDAVGMEWRYKIYIRLAHIRLAEDFGRMVSDFVSTYTGKTRRKLDDEVSPKKVTYSGFDAKH